MIYKLNKKMFINDENDSNPYLDSYKMLRSKNPKKDLKDKCMDYSNNYMEQYNKSSDEEYNKKHPNTKGDIFDKMNHYITEGLYTSDQYFGTGVLGHVIASSGRIARNNYEQNYQRSPFTDPFERSYDAYQKATNIDY